MKKIMPPLIAVVLLAASSLVRADSQATDNTPQAAMQATKKAIVTRNMILTADQGKVFWPLYDQYQIEQNKLNAERMAILTKFSINYDNLTDELVRDLLDKSLTLEKKRVNLKLEWMDKFNKVLPPKVVARYYQIENKLEATVANELAQQILLAK